MATEYNFAIFVNRDDIIRLLGKDLEGSSVYRDLLMITCTLKDDCQYYGLETLFMSIDTFHERVGNNSIDKIIKATLYHQITPVCIV